MRPAAGVAMGSKQDQTEDGVFTNVSGAEVAELVAIWQRLSPSRRHLLLEQVRRAAAAEQTVGDPAEPTVGRRE